VKKGKAAEDELQPEPGKWVWIEPGKALPRLKPLPPVPMNGSTQRA